MGNCQSINQQEIQTPRQGPVQYLNIHNHVWSRKYLGLYDYEASEVQKRKYKVQGNAIVLKQKQKLILIDERMDKLSKGLNEHMKNAIFRLIRNDNFYQMIPIAYEEKEGLVQRPLWLIVRSLPRKEYSIKERDIFKLGKQKMRVREVVPADAKQTVIMPNQSIRVTKTTYDDLHYKQKEEEKVKKQSQKQVESKQVERKEDKLKQVQSKEVQQLEKQQNRLERVESSKTIGAESGSGKNQNQNICRICLEPGLTTNPLITPCQCIGTVRYIHLICLKTWLSKQIKAVINDFSVTINWKPLFCEMCKAHYKYRIYLDNQKFYTVDIPKPQKPYIVLEIMKKKNKEDCKIFKFITFKQKNKINIGRKKDVDVKISDDISVSRIHAMLKYREETRQFILEDNKSKFGTLVLAKNGINLRPHHNGISVQVGAEMFEFQPVREATTERIPNYELGDEYMREEESQLSEDDSNASEEEDEVPEMALDDNDRSPSTHRSPSIRRTQTMNIMGGGGQIQ